MIFRKIKDNPRGTLVVFLYRVANSASRAKKSRPINGIWAIPVLILYKLITEFIFGYEIPAATVIGSGLLIDHGYGLVINKHSIIGRNCRIKHGVTIGCQTLEGGAQGPSPKIGDDVDIGAGSIILGEITIGNRVKIAAGAIVTKNVPSDCTIRSPYSNVFENR